MSGGSSGTPAREREILLVAHPGRAEITRDRATGRARSSSGPGSDCACSSTRPTARVSNRWPAWRPTIPGPRAEVTIVQAGPDAAVGCEMVLVLGGDGTFLRAAELAQAASIPVLGINLGRIGFLAETEAEHLDEALAQVVRREYRIEHRMTLDVLGPGRRRDHRTRLGTQRGEHREPVPARRARGGARGGRPPRLVVRLRRRAHLPPRPDRRHTRSPQVGPSCGRNSRRCW